MVSLREANNPDWHFCGGAACGLRRAYHAPAAVSAAKLRQLPPPVLLPPPLLPSPTARPPRARCLPGCPAGMLISERHVLTAAHVRLLPALMLCTCMPSSALPWWDATRPEASGVVAAAPAGRARAEADWCAAAEKGQQRPHAVLTPPSSPLSGCPHAVQCFVGYFGERCPSYFFSDLANTGDYCRPTVGGVAGGGGAQPASWVPQQG